MSLVRKYGLLAYWLAFAGLTVYEAQYPGFEDLSRWKYPWLGVAAVWLLLAVLVSLLYLILRPKTYHRSWARLGAAFVYSGALLFLGASSVVTDMPGYYYVPAMFSVVTMCGVIIIASVTAGAALLQRMRRAA